jgi:hypothetical protein
MKQATLIVFLLAVLVQAGAQQIILSNNARISLMTVAPGEELYSTFGHSAIRVFDPANSLDRCYNYGTFEFDQPNFYMKFMRGRLLYFLDVEATRGFEYFNIRQRRAMREQLLNLDSLQRQRLFDLLTENALPQNKYYKYDFFYDNCATRIRDIVQESHFHQLIFDSSSIPQPRTMRQLLHPCLTEMPWTRFGIDLILGQAADRMALADDYMFLPDYVHDMFAGTKLPDGRPLVTEERTIPEWSFPKTTTNDSQSLFGNPLWIMILVAVVGLLSMANPRATRIFDTFFWLTLGLAGLLMAFLWFATDHSATKTNWNLLWALPTHLLFFWRDRRSEWVDNYFTGAAMLAALALLLWKFLPQEMPLEAIPIAGLVVVKGLWQRVLSRWMRNKSAIESDNDEIAAP